MLKASIRLMLIGLMISACALKEKKVVECEKHKYENIQQVCPDVPPCPVCEKPKPPVTKLVFKDYGKLIIGAIEDVYFPAYKLTLQARIDTGATTSSISAQNIVPFERDGKKWVRFELLDRDQRPVQIKKPIIRKIKVKQHGEDAQERYVVEMRLNVSSLSQFIEVSLSDRSEYKFPVLIGRNYLQENILVDVSKKFTKRPTERNE